MLSLDTAHKVKLTMRSVRREPDYRQGAEVLKERTVYLLVGKPNKIFMGLEIL